MIRPKFFDILLFFLFAGFVIVSAVQLFGTVNGGVAQVLIQSDSGEWIYPLDVDQPLITIPGPIGNTIVAIFDGAAVVKESPCKDKLCQIHGALKKDGDWTACLPNKVIIEISAVSDEEDGIDILSY